MALQSRRHAASMAQPVSGLPPVELGGEPNTRGDTSDGHCLGLGCVAGGHWGNVWKNASFNRARNRIEMTVNVQCHCLLLSV